MTSIKAKKVKWINKKMMITTLDIGKTVHYGYFRAPNGSDVKAFPFYNSKKSFNTLWGKICQFKREHQLEEVVIGFESTGPYAEPLFHFLRKKDVKLVQVNPVHTKRIKELTGNSPDKTDKKDPRVIADIISLGHALTLIVPKGAAAHLRRMTQARERALKQRTATINQLQDLIFVIFPEFLSIMKNITTKTASYLITHHPSAESICAMGVKALVATMKKISRGQLGHQRAQELVAAAKNSVGIYEGKESILLEIEHLNCKIEFENSGCILSIKGIGTVTAAGLIGEVADFNKFDTISEVMKLAGLDLYEISSGRHKGQRRISKRGRPLMRKLLFFMAINTVKSKGIMHAKYQQMLAQGMIKMKALVAISRKLLGIIFALVRDNTKYMENYSGNYHYKLAA